MQAKLLTLCMALCAVCLSATSQNLPDYVLSDGLVVWYPLDGDATDFGPFNIQPDYAAAEPAANRFQQEGRAMSFIDDEDFIQGPADLFPVTDRTLSFWFNMPLDSPENWLIGYGGGTSGTSTLLYSNSVQCNIGNSLAHSQHGCQSVFGISLSTLQANAWHHCVLSSDSLGSLLYIDGTIASNGPTLGSVNTSNRNFFIGGGPSPDGEALGYNFHGQLDDVGVWNRALTEEEILALYNAEPPVLGCTDSTACNYDAEAPSNDGSCIPSGCMDSEACNYNALAECEGEECAYTCCPGPGCCGEGTDWNPLEQTCESIPCETILNPLACGPGTYWDETVNQCLPILTCQEDLDGDGVIGINDLMQLLSSFGTMCEEPETSEFTCGDPMNYHGYDYPTVLIGEQCWFAENCRHLPAVSPPDIGFEDDGQAHAYVYGYDGNDTALAAASSNYSIYGVLYNRLAAENWELCPAGWHVPSDSNIPHQGDFMELYYHFPTNQSGASLKANSTDNIPWDGTNSSGFNAIPSGNRSLYWDGEFSWLGEKAFYWSSATTSRRLDTNHDNLDLMGLDASWGLSVRCVKDTE
ncbi:MAG: hypothetical protein OSA78_04210 [Flavobacteriales bacterium]|nr:hypothetical protein [Flavobacteriales bacterium]